MACWVIEHAQYTTRPAVMGLQGRRKLKGDGPSSPVNGVVFLEKQGGPL